jgi:hypothetical protein
MPLIICLCEWGLSLDIFWRVTESGVERVGDSTQEENAKQT